MDKEKKVLRFFKIKIDGVFLFASLIVGLIILFYFTMVEKKVKKEIFSRLDGICVLKKEAINDIIGNNSKIISSIAARRNLRKQLEKLQKSNKNHDSIVAGINQILCDIFCEPEFFAENFDDIFVINNRGKIVAGSKKENIGKSLVDSKIYLEGSKSFYQGYWCFESKLLFYQFSAPIFDLEERNVLGVVGVKARPYKIISILSKYTGLNKGGRIFLGKLGEKNIMLFTSSLSQFGEVLQITVPLLNITRIKAMKYALEEKKGITPDINFQGKKTLCAYQHIPKVKWGIVVEVERKAALASIRNLRIQTGLVLSAIIILFSLLLKRQKNLKKSHMENQKRGEIRTNVLVEEFKEVNQLIFSAIEWEKLMPLIMNEAIKLVKADGGILALTQKDKGKKTLVFPYHCNIPEDSMRMIVSEKEKLLEYMAAIKEKFSYIDNYPQYHKEEFPWFTQATVKSLIIIPLLLEGKENIGFLMLFGFRCENQFFEKEISVLATLVDNMALAIHNASRFRQIILINEKLQCQREDVSGANKKIIESERVVLLRQLTEGIGHDLRNPLATIKNAVYLIKKRMANSNFLEKDPEIDRYLQMIDEKINLSDKIMRDLLYFSQKIKSKHTRSKIDLMVEKALSSLPLPTNIKIIKELNLPNKEILAGSVQIIHAFMNIILNAYQSMPQGGKLKIQTKEVKTGVEIIFSDTGVGINSQHIEKIFGPYYSTKGKMLGLGLAIAKEAIENHNGKIVVESKKNKGTSFIVRLPKG